MKPTVLVVDTEFIKAHKVLNKKIVSWLVNDYDLVFIDNKYGIFDYIEGTKINTSNYNQQSNKFSRIIGFLCTTFLILKIVKKQKIDKVLLLSYEYRSLSFFINKISKRTEVIAFHHNDIDRDFKKFGTYFFKAKYHRTFMLCRHIVFHEFIKKYLISQLSDFAGENIFLMNLPITREIKHIKRSVGKIKKIVSISETNEKKWVHELIEDEEKRKIFKKNDIKIIIKDNSNEYDDGYVKIFSGFLPDSKYENIISESDSFLRFFSLDFYARSSGTIIDSLSLGTPFIGNDIEVVREFETQYPLLVKSFSTYEELIKIILNWEVNLDERSNEFDKFLKDFSDKKIEKSFLRALGDEIDE
ncbi:hypothetical protein [Enterococcus sp. AZ109]|uniref:hypothetical protein n=1 Tax=Enterococcus sp. AZ109 TaxID=2774634 RepID=UPI003F23B18A